MSPRRTAGKRSDCEKPLGLGSSLLVKLVPYYKILCLATWRVWKRNAELVGPAVDDLRERSASWGKIDVTKTERSIPEGLRA